MIKKQSKYILVIVLCFVSNVFSQATTVDVSGTNTTLTITNALQTVVDPSLIITANGNITGFTVTITGSYTAGDVLSYVGALPTGITAATFNGTSRSLVFSGTTTAANWEALLRTVTIQTVSAVCYQEQRQVSFVVGKVYYNNLNGHFYENFTGSITWGNALLGASTKSYFGRQGYLATMTSLAETNFIWKIISVDSWMGASDSSTYINAATGTTTYANDADSEGKWYWVSGPEKGTMFSLGNGTPVTQPGQFAYWNTGEPNDSGGDEDCGQFYSNNGGHWNDLRMTSSLSSYIVEYGGMSTDNVNSNVVFTRDLLLLGAQSGTVTGGNVTVCSSDNTVLTLTGLASGSSVVKWQYSYDDFLTAGIDIVNTTTSFTANNITQNTYYRAVVNTPDCTELNTSSTRLNINEAIAGNIVADNNIICVNSNVGFTLNGYTGDITKWQVSTTSDFSIGVIDIANTTPFMSYQITTAGTYYFRAVIQSCSSTVYTSGYTISCIAGTPPSGGVVSNASFCGGSNSGALTLSGHTGNITKWQYSVDGGIVWIDINNTTNTFNFTGITTTTKYRAQLTSGSCGTAWSNVGEVFVSNQSPIISYAVSGAQLYPLNTAIPNLEMANYGGDAENYSISPALPTGLVLQPNGTINGTPTVASSLITYTITATNACGNDTVTIEMATGAVPTISNFNSIDKMYFEGSFNIMAPSSNSTGVFSYISSNPAVATISGTLVTMHSVGTTTITANQAADATYTNGTSITLLTVTSTQLITINGKISSTDLDYVNKNGIKSGTSSLTTNGQIILIKHKDGLTSSSAGTSAYQIKQSYPSSTDGLYWITNQNINSGIPFQIYADMTTDGGGWMILNVGSGTTAAPESSTLTSPDILGYLPRTTVIELAKLSTDVQLRAGNSSTSYTHKTTSTSPLAIGALQSTATDVNGASTWANEASSTFVVNSGTWFWAYCCPGTAMGWPKMYHSVNNINGVHWFADSGSGRSFNPTDAWFSTWIR